MTEYREMQKRHELVDQMIYEIMSLPSYGLIAERPENPMISREAVVKILRGPGPRQPTREELGDGFC